MNDHDLHEPATSFERKGFIYRPAQSLALHGELAAAIISAIVLAISSYWFFADDHRIDRVLLFGLPSPSGSPAGDGSAPMLAWLFTALGRPDLVFIAAAGLTLIFGFTRCFAQAAMVVVMVAGGAVAGYTAKAFTGYLRPHHLSGSTEMLHTSFPSGHALLATLLFGAIALSVIPMIADFRKRAFVLAAAAFVAAMVGISRIYLCTHWPSDVFAGWAMGILWLLAMRTMFLRLSGPLLVVRRTTGDARAS